MKLRRATLALGISLAFHAAVFVVLSRRKPPLAPSPRDAPVAIELQVFEKYPPLAAPPSAGSAQRAPSGGRQAANRLRKSPSSGFPQGKGKPPKPAESISMPLKDDSPRGASLLPGVHSWSGFSKPAPAPESHGQTIQGTAQERPDPETVAAVEAERAKRRIEGWVKDDVAFLRVESGVVDGYFHEMKKMLEQSAKDPPKFDSHPIRNFLAGWSAAAKRYGSGQNPYQDEGSAREGEFISPLSRARQDTAGTRYEGFANKLEQGAALRRFADAGPGGLLAVVEFRQAATGKLLSSILLQSSGDKSFDAHVMRTAPEAIAKLPAPGAGGAGIHPDGIRSAWAFEGRVVYKKKLRDVNLKSDWWYFAAATPLALVTGNFEETTGDVYVVDLHDPKYTCTVRLLRVY